MALLYRLWTKLSLLFSRKRFHLELDEEMAFHRQQNEKELIASGVSEEEARYAAIRQFGNVAKLRGQSEEIIGFRAETIVQDVRFALRQLRRNLGFAMTAILILALGIGVSIAIFGFVDAALMQPLPYQHPDRLVGVTESSGAIPRANLSRDDYEEWKRMNTSLSSLEAYTGTGYLLHMGNATEPVPGERVSDGFFRTLGVKPILGRDFLPGEADPGKPAIVILPYNTWQKRFGGRKDIIGQTVSLSDETYTIVGVLPREFAFAPRGNAEFWTPLRDKNGCEQRRSCHNLQGVGRLKDGVTVQAAAADMKRIAAQLEKQYPGSNKGQGGAVDPLVQLIIGDVKPILLTLLGGALLLLSITCVNVSSLLLVRSESRRREIALRGAIGATPFRLMRQFVTEGLLLAAIGCAGALLIALWLMTLLAHLVPKQMAAGMPFLNLVGLNPHTCLFATAVALFAAALLAATPFLRLSGEHLQDSLSDGGRGTGYRFWRRLGANLVVVELSIAVVLLAGGGLLTKSFYKLLHVETGFDPSHLAVASVVVHVQHYQAEQVAAIYTRIEQKLMSLPGVQAVGFTTDLPLQCNCNTDWIRIVGKPFHGEHNEVNYRAVSAGYLPALKAQLVRGRMFTSHEAVTSPQPMIINETFARKYFAGEDPIGQKVGNGDLSPDSMREIVGVVSDVREGSQEAEIWPAEYLPLEQGPSTEFSVVVRTAQDEKAFVPTLVNALHSVDPGMGIHGEATMMQIMESTQAALLHRFAAWLVGGFALIALLLSVIGLYGVIAYSVSQRTREIGVRMALGARRGSVYALVMRQSGRLTAIGIGLGLACSLGASQLMRKLLFGVQVWDASTLLGVGVVLASASLLASFMPAHRAALINPTDALRAE